MLRRFECYEFDPDAPETARDRLRSALLDASRFIPEVLHSAIGEQVTGADVDLVWEHAFESAAAYRRYMEHPFHASVLDRYLLADSPERVVADSRLGIGLAGYRCEEPDYVLSSGMRWLAFLDLRRARSAEVEKVGAMARRGVADVSVFAPNSLASAWFDGESPVGPGPRWSHLWEQGFEDPAGLGSGRAAAPGAGDPGSGTWEDVPGVAAALTIGYLIGPGGQSDP